MNRVVHFEIQAKDPEKTADFYREVFGWEIKKWDSDMMEYWMIMTAPAESKEPGINGGLLHRDESMPERGRGSNTVVCTVLVENFDETADKIMKAGGTVALPKFALPGMAWQGYFLDIDGNSFGVHQVDEKAQ